MEAQIAEWRKSLGIAPTSAGHESFNSTRNASPVSPASLLPIDYQILCMNPAFRHDLFFKHDLFFNLTGKVTEERRRQEQFWVLLQHEISIQHKLLLDDYDARSKFPDLWDAAFQTHVHRLQAVSEALEGVVQSIVTAEHSHAVADRLKTAHLVQNISRQTFDLSAFAHWMGDLLRQHCSPSMAPLVNEWMSEWERMHETISSDTVVRALKILFHILQQMKLEITNHLLRSLRPRWLASGITYFQTHYHLQIRNQNFNVSSSVAWYRKNPEPTVSISETSPVRHFASKAVHSILAALEIPSRYSFPPTFGLDYTRLDVLADGLRCWINLTICQSLLAQRLRSMQQPEDRVREVLAVFRAIIPVIVSNSRWTDMIGNIAIEILVAAAQDASKRCGCTDITASHDQSVAHRYHLWALSRSRFHILLDENNKNDSRCRRYHPTAFNLGPDAADEVDQLEAEIRNSLDPESSAFQRELNVVRQLLLSRVPRMMEENLRLSANALWEKFSPFSRPMVHPLSSLRDSSTVADLPTDSSVALDPIASNIADIFAHILILHWKIWGPIYQPQHHGVVDYINCPGGSDRMRNFEEYLDRFPVAKRDLYGTRGQTDGVDDEDLDPILVGAEPEPWVRRGDVRRARNG